MKTINLKRIKSKDKFSRVWNLPKIELCQTCGQPDNCGDCNHKKLPLKYAKILQE